ncbi:MAG: acetyl-CoA carboxylase biotin carboxyl carrier protein [Planctomycetaceae bacterium]|nr:acetyl-CoA carboxylase biotin carboxyl carrier protein [Planctomycetaceae bacterium]
MSEDLNNASQPTGGEAFDLEKLQHLMELMEKHGLTELSLKNSGQLWRLRRGGHESVPMMAPQPMYAPPPQPVGPSPTGGGGSEPQPAPAVETGLLIKSPTVGTFYAAPSPDDPPFVSVGSKVQPDTTVCTVEAMKVFNPIPAGVSGTIVAVLVNNGDAVEFDQPLFRVDP